jgi:hypothetical protein
MRETRAELAAHVGGRPTAVQSALIERAAQLSLRIAAMDRRFAELGKQTDHDSRTYLAWSNSLTRTLAQLGVAGAVEKPPLGFSLACRARYCSPPALGGRIQDHRPQVCAELVGCAGDPSACFVTVGHSTSVHSRGAI